ncbi:hypothetical protein JB92DRAFT_2965095 [Gautieria morchelliformis]|nr:hypothetical protein JB92DRAFT_2965095 [Gautieria morchelliformis]
MVIGSPSSPHSNTMRFPSCGHDDAVFYPDQSKRREAHLILFYVCCKCGHSFMDPDLKEYTGPQGGGGAGPS